MNVVFYRDAVIVHLRPHSCPHRFTFCYIYLLNFQVEGTAYLCVFGGRVEFTLPDIHGFVIIITIMVVALRQTKEQRSLPTFLIDTQVSNHRRIFNFLIAVLPPISVCV